METDINHVHLTGTVENDAILKELPNGKIVTNVLVRMNESVTIKGGSQIQLTNVVKIIAWGGLAEHTRDVAKVGARLCVHGRISVSEWEGRHGEKNVCYEVHLTQKIKTIEEWLEQVAPSPPLTPKYPEPE